MTSIKVAIAIGWMSAALDRERPEAERDARVREIWELLRDIGND